MGKVITLDEGSKLLGVTNEHMLTYRESDGQYAVHKYRDNEFVNSFLYRSLDSKAAFRHFMTGENRLINRLPNQVVVSWKPDFTNYDMFVSNNLIFYNKDTLNKYLKDSNLRIENA